MGEDSGLLEWDAQLVPAIISHILGTTFPQNLGEHVHSDTVSHPIRPEF